VESVQALTVPTLAAKRHLITIRRDESSMLQAG
jgi:hypothetical protein